MTNNEHAYCPNCQTRHITVEKCKPRSFHDHRDRGDPMVKVEPHERKEEDELWKLGKGF